MGAKINYLFSADTYYGITIQGLPLLVLEGMAELVHGIDDARKDNLNNLVSNVNTLEKALVLKPSVNSVDGVYAPDYVAGYTFLRYLAKQAADSNFGIVNTASNTLISGTSAAGRYQSYNPERRWQRFNLQQRQLRIYRFGQ